LTFISRCSGFFQNESCRVQFEQLVNACIQYALSPRAAIERGCSIGEIMLKLSADEFESKDAPRCVRTIPDNPSTFQQALYASFSLKQVIVRYLKRAAA
jgi:hypothetical protein